MHNPRPSPHQRLPIAILADDLSGAADSAVAFAARGLSARVSLATFEFADAEVLAIDLDARRQASRDAASRITSGWRLAKEHGATTLFRKIDSKLRGHVCAELLALAACVDPRAVIVVCPAHPAAGVRYRAGRPWGNDGPMSALPGATDFAALALAWRAAGLPVVSDRPAMGVSELELYLAQIVHDVRAPHLALVDAESERDLDAVVRFALASAPPSVLVGSGGLAAALSRLFGSPRMDQAGDPPRWPAAGRAMVIAGSNTAFTRCQLEHLARADLGKVHWLAPGESRLADARTDALAAVALGGLRDARPADSGEILAAFAAACVPAAVQADALVLTGGETARVILDGLGVQALEIVMELAPGMVLSRAIGAWSGSVVTKSGSFGAPDALERALRVLRGGAWPLHTPGLGVQKNEVLDA